MKHGTTIEIENDNGDTMMVFAITVDQNGEFEVTKVLDCSHADTECGDDYFDTKNNTMRIQSDCQWERNE